MNKSNRIKYRFTLEFPAKPFTVRSLRAHGAHPKYITAYVRVKNALKAGIIEAVGSKTPTEARRGRKELLYRRANAKAPLTAAQNIAVKV